MKIEVKNITGGNQYFKQLECFIELWTTENAAGYKIVNRNTGLEITICLGHVKSAVLEEVEKLSKVTGMEIVRN